MSIANISLWTEPEPELFCGPSLVIDVMNAGDAFLSENAMVQLDPRTREPTRQWWLDLTYFLRSRLNADRMVDPHARTMSVHCADDVGITIQRGTMLDSLEIAALTYNRPMQRIDVQPVSHAARERLLEVLAEPQGPRICTEHPDCLTNSKLAAECMRERAGGPPRVGCEEGLADAAAKLREALHDE